MPGLRGALSVRVNDGKTDRIVTRYCRGLKFTKVAPGGHQALSFKMTLPRDTFGDLGPAGRVYVYDARTARTVIEGYTENPTPTDGPGGQEYDVSAVGGMALASDETRALIYITQELDGFEQAQTAAASASASQGGVTPGWLLQFNPGQPIATNSLAKVQNPIFRNAAMNLGAMHLFTYSGKTDTGYRAEFFYNSGYKAVGDSAAINTGGLPNDLWVGTDFPATLDDLVLQLRRVGGATNIADDLTWSFFSQISMLGQRMDRRGTLLTGSGGMVSTTEVLASQVVEDLLGRLLTMCDPGTAQVDATAYGIDQLAYPDGVKAAGVLNDLAVFEPDYLWEILETLDSGLHRFNYRAWPTTPRYEFTVADGWQQSGSDVDLCNRILVSWTDPAGKTQVTPVTAEDLGLVGLGLPVDELYAQGRTKDADPIALPEGKGSLANAMQIGGQILTDKINPPKAGTVTVRRPIVDRLTGNTVEPWEVEPGYVGQVRETGDDLRITQMDYDDDACAATLTLGRPALTDEQRLARLDRATQTLLVGV